MRLNAHWSSHANSHTTLQEIADGFNLVGCCYMFEAHGECEAVGVLVSDVLSYGVQVAFIACLPKGVWRWIWGVRWGWREWGALALPFRGPPIWKTKRRDGIQTNNSSFSSSMVRREDRGGRIEGNLRMTSHVIVDGYYPNGLSIYQKFLLSERTRVLQHAIIRYEHDERNGILESKMEILLPFPVNWPSEYHDRARSSPVYSCQQHAVYSRQPANKRQISIINRWTRSISTVCSHVCAGWSIMTLIDIEQLGFLQGYTEPGLCHRRKETDER